jgi:hypothetical protein
VNAQATTVGDIHAITGGPKGVHPWATVFASLPDGSFAAWCWRQPSPRTYASYVAGPNGQIVDAHSGTQGDPPAPGPLPVT